MSALMIRPLFLSRNLLGSSPIVKSAFSTTQCVNAKPIKAAAKAKVMSQMVERKRMTVETDPQKLVTHLCGGNYFITGEDPKLKPDEEYPDWLWTLRTERGHHPLEDLDTDSPQYWRIVKRKAREKRSREKKTKRKYNIF